MSRPSRLSAPPAETVFRSAFRAGGLRAVCLRPSARRGGAAVVLVAAFARPASAGRFAALWARRLGVSVVVRRRGPWSLVSVPVFASVSVSFLSSSRAAWGCPVLPSRLLPRGGAVWPVAGGVRAVGRLALSVGIAAL